MADVLIVDDDVSIRETLRMVLEDEGHAVEEAEDGLVALDALRATRAPRVVLLDLMMPRLDGAGVLGVVAGDRRLAEAHAFALITATNQTRSLAFVRLLSELRVPVLYKPFDVDTVLETVETLNARLRVAQNVRKRDH